jgi:hypothetical protein
MDRCIELCPVTDESGGTLFNLLFDWEQFQALLPVSLVHCGRKLRLCGLCTHSLRGEFITSTWFAFRSRRRPLLVILAGSYCWRSIIMHLSTRDSVLTLVVVGSGSTRLHTIISTHLQITLTYFPCPP